MNHEVARNLNTHHNTVNKQCASTSAHVAHKASDACVASSAKASTDTSQNTLAHASSLCRSCIFMPRKAMCRAGCSEVARCSDRALHALSRDAMHRDERIVRVVMHRLRDVKKKVRRYRIAQGRLRKNARTLRRLSAASSNMSAKKIGRPEAADRCMRCACGNVSDPRLRSARRSHPAQAVRPVATRRRSSARTASHRHRHRR